jgi:hypothetical protein
MIIFDSASGLFPCVARSTGMTRHGALILDRFMWAKPAGVPQLAAHKVLILLCSCHSSTIIRIHNRLSTVNNIAKFTQFLEVTFLLYLFVVDLTLLCTKYHLILYDVILNSARRPLRPLQFHGIA